MTLSDLRAPSTLLDEMRARGFTDATPVQRAVADADGNKDLIVSSQTGSGKTVAFGLACAAAILDDKDNGRRGKAPRALVIAPTRELALQVARELSWLYKRSGARIGTCVGGMDPRREGRTLHLGVDIVVGTPGRLVDHIQRGALVLDALAAVVLDEADEMLDMGFRDELEKILDATPSSEEGRRTLMFSATFPKPMEALAKKYLRDPLRLQASALVAAHQDIEYKAHLIAPNERELAVVNVLRFHDAPSALVFCATREGVFHMHASLVERGFHAAALSGELSQAERNRALQSVREGRARVLVCTDVAARGLDLPAVALVVHADPPQDLSSFQHRSGRTGRAGRKGTAVLLAPAQRRRQMEYLLKDAQVQARFTPPPTAQQIRSLDDQRIVHQAVTLAAADDDAVALDAADDAGAVGALLAQLSPEAVAGVVVRLLRKELPAPEEMPQTAAWKSNAKDHAARDRRDVRPGSRDPRGAQDTRGGRGGRRDDRDDDDSGGGVRGVWFSVNVGRDQRADPKWLLPMLCRRGGVVKRDLGQMDIRRRETRFEVHPDVAEKFADLASKPDKKDPHIRIERASG